MTIGNGHRLHDMRGRPPRHCVRAMARRHCCQVPYFDGRPRCLPGGIVRRRVDRQVRKWLVRSAVAAYGRVHARGSWSRSSRARASAYGPGCALRWPVLHRRDVDRHLLPAHLSLPPPQRERSSLLGGPLPARPRPVFGLVCVVGPRPHRGHRHGWVHPPWCAWGFATHR